MGIRERSDKTKKLALAAMLSALGVVLLYFGSIIEILDLTVVAFASFFVFFALIELGTPYQYLIYGVTSALSLLLLPNRFAAVMYFCFGGIYPVFKYAFEKYHYVVSWILKLSFFNTVITLMIVISKYIMHIEEDTASFTLGFYLLGNAAFILFDIAASKIVLLYTVKLRKRFGIDKLFKKRDA